MEKIEERLGPQILFDFSEILRAIEFVRESGFSVLEINLNNPYFLSQIKDKKTREKIRKEKESGMKILFHSLEGLSFFLPEANLVNASFSFLKEILDYLWEIEAERLTIHLGNDFTFGITGKKVLTYEVFPDFYQERMEEVIKNLSEMSKGKTILCIENVGGFRYPFVMAIIERYLGNNLGLTLDIGHINRLPKDKQIVEKEFFLRNRQHIKNCHIHDNSGEWDEHNIVGEGKIDIPYYLKMVNGTDSYLIAEVRPKESALESLRRLKLMLGR
jgi:sugar phosphate isomerase/epimerase|uniref:Sugar phosphate isomerase/epimerase n=1 Tax=candidate division WOR-3 bacterium TaxID=2052148 RepID=A0A7C3URV3_UNCW3